jgi:hypothetical protein
MVKLDTIEGHLVLWCKGHYGATCNAPLMEQLKRIWAIRCGLDHEHVRDDVYEYIADGLYEILVSINPEIKPRLHEIIHKGLVWPFYYGYDKDDSAIVKLIYIYRSHIMSTKIKEKSEWESDKYVDLVGLPKPQKGIMNRILNGKGDFHDDELLKKKDKR